MPKDGVYDLNIDGAKVHPSGVPSVNMAGVSTTTFFRLFGDTDDPFTPSGGATNVDFEALVSLADNFTFRGSFNSSANYKAFLDFGGDGNIGVDDNFAFRGRFNKGLIWRV